MHKDQLRPHIKDLTQGVCVIMFTSDWSGSTKEGKIKLWLAKRSTGKFKGRIEFPGGHREPRDKRARSTAKRELKEETGLEIRESELLDLGIYAGVDPKGMVYGTHCFAIDLWPDQKPKHTEYDKRTPWEKIKFTEVLKADPEELMPCAPTFLARLRWHFQCKVYEHAGSTRPWLLKEKYFTYEVGHE